MARNGSGTYNRVHNWQQDADAGIDITASRMDAEDDGFATGLTNSLAKDGQTIPTANLPMGGFKHTNVDDASARNQYASAGQIQDSGLIYGDTGGSSNAYTFTPTPAITAYTAGQRFILKANHNNTGAATLNVSGLGTKAIQRKDGSAVESGDIVSGTVYDVTYNGTAFVLSATTVVSASTTTAGIVELATSAETETGTDTTRAITPAGGEATYLKQSNNLSDVDTAATAATNLGLGTGDSPQFTAVEVGNASDTTLARASAGDLNVEGNIIYRAGGTDVPVTDGGTGSSSASGARTNLGLGSVATRDTGVGTASEIPDRADADGRYAQLAAANTFTEAQTIQGAHSPALLIERSAGGNSVGLTSNSGGAMYFYINGTLEMRLNTDGGISGDGATTGIESIRVGATNSSEITAIISATATLDFPSTSGGSQSSLDMTVTGAATGDAVFVSGPTTGASNILVAIVSSSDTVKVTYCNHTGGALNPSSGTYRATVIKF